MKMGTALIGEDGGDERAITQVCKGGGGERGERGGERGGGGERGRERMNKE